MQIDKTIRYVYDAWHKATKTGDLELLGSLYATSATFESPSVLVTWPKHTDGVVVGRTEIVRFLGDVYQARKDVFGQWYRTDTPFVNGKQLVWEYPRETPSGPQADIVEVMNIEDGVIQAHRVYWGWYGVKALLAAAKR